jgi:hypothetical protein
MTRRQSADAMAIRQREPVGLETASGPLSATLATAVREVAGTSSRDAPTTQTGKPSGPAAALLARWINHQGSVAVERLVRPWSGGQKGEERGVTGGGGLDVAARKVVERSRSPLCRMEVSQPESGRSVRGGEGEGVRERVGQRGRGGRCRSWEGLTRPLRLPRRRWPAGRARQSLTGGQSPLLKPHECGVDRENMFFR